MQYGTREKRLVLVISVNLRMYIYEHNDVYKSVYTYVHMHALLFSICIF